MFNWRKNKKPAAPATPNPHRAPSSSPRPKQSLLSLEQRLMFDAAAAATASEVASEQVAQEQADAAVSMETSHETTSADTAESQDVLNALATYMPTELRTEVIFVDPTVPNYQELLAGMDPNTEVIMLDASTDGVQQIAENLAGRTGIDAVHLISHGSSGELQLGAGTLTAESMSGRYAGELATIREALSTQADILVYGCDFAGGPEGIAAVNRLAELTGADVDASNDLTGHISLGGDWEFEVKTGEIETKIAVTDEAQMNWAGLLGTETVKDQFSSASYSNNNGTQSWSTSWSETDAGGGGASGGDVRVNSNQLRIDTDTVGNAVSRGVNLSGATSATLTFDYTNTLTGADRIEIRVSTEGGTNYQTLSSGIFSNAANTGSGSASFNLSGYMSANTRIQFIVTGTGGGDRLFVDNVQVSYGTGSTNSAPSIGSLSGDSLAYNEGSGAVVIEQGANALVTDIDSANFDTGSLTVRFTAGSDSAEDVLSIQNQGTGAGQIGVSGSNVTYGGVTIGTFTGGSSGSNLVVTLNASATPTAVTALVQHITYQDTDTNAPTTGARTVRYVLTDGDGGTSANYDTTVTVSGVNDAPTDLALSANTVAENAATGTVVGTITGTDVDTGDTKAYSLTDTAGGRFSINSATGQITVANGSLLNYEAAASHTVTVRVTDSGGLTYDEAFTINLTNVNEAPTGADATVTINEDTPRTLTAANFGFSDVDAGDTLSAVRIDSVPTAGSLTLSGVAVTAGQVVTAADITAGCLVFTPAANANGTGYATVAFSVRDSAGSFDGAPNTLTVSVTPVNDAPVLSTNEGGTVDEGGAIVLTGKHLQVADVDTPPNELRYTLTSLPANGALLLKGTPLGLKDSFTQEDINNGILEYVHGSNTTLPANDTILLREAQLTGKDTVAQASIDSSSLEYAHDGGEAASDSFAFVVSDGAGGNLGESMFKIAVTPVNDAPVLSTNEGGTVDEGGAIVLTGKHLHVTDADTPPNELRYMLTSLPANGALLLKGTPLGLKDSFTQEDINNEILEYVHDGSETTSDSLTFVVEDGTGGTLKESTFEIVVNSVNEAPTDLSLSANTVAENAASGMVVGTITGTDVDTGDTKAYSLTDTAGGRFGINSSTGVITVANASLLNYEAANSHSVTVRVTDSGGLTYDETFTINLTNVNETPTDLALSANTVTENAATGTVVGTVSGTDVDAGDTKSYSLTNTAGGRFAINSSTGVITVADGSLLNYEAATSHNITVRVTDSGGLTYDEAFAINLINVNEAPTGADATVTISEDTSHTLTTANFGFSDVDAGDALSAVRIDTLPGSGTLTLSGAAVMAGQVVTVADINAGNVVFTPAANANGTGYATLTFSVRDSTNGYDAAPNSLTFNVTAVNDAPTLTAGTVSNLIVSEDAGLASLGLGSVAYSPAGGADESGQTLNYAVTAIPSASVGNVFLADGTTRVTVGSYSLADIQGMQFKPTANASGVTAFQFNVYDSGGTANGGANNISQFILITVNAVNDASTITNLSGDSLSYSEGDGAVVIEQSGNALVADVDSANLDTGALTVSIPAGGDSAEDVLSIQNQGTGTGQIGANGSNVTYGGVTIGTFTGGSSGSNLVVTLNASATPTAVTALVQHITYQDTDTNAPTTGARTVRYVLTDGDGGTSANYDTTVTVSGVNDAPTDLALSANQVAENAATGTVVGTVSGTDPDSGDSKSYSLTDMAGGRFAINSSTGVITVANGSLLNFESAASHSVTVRVTDSGGATYDEAFTINLTNVNEAPTGTDATVTISEDTSHTLTSANFGFSDVDAGDSLSAVRINTLPGAGTLTLAGVAVTAGQVVTVVDINAGNVVFTPAANANGTGYATLTFSVRDSNNGYDFTPNSLTFDVTAINDAPLNTVPGLQTVNEDTALTISGISVTDVDGNLSTVQLGVAQGTLNVRVQGGATISAGANGTGTLTVSGTQVDINATLATLSYQGNVNFTGSDLLTVTSRDSNAVTNVDTVAITVNPVNDAPKDLSLSANTVAENAVNGTVVGTVTGIDIDAGDVKSYSLTGTAGGRFAINSSTGVITVANDSLLNYEAATSHTVTVRVTDSSGTTYDETFAINVTNVNEALTDVSLSANTVVEKATNGTVVGNVTGTDPDAGDTHTYQLMDTAGGRFAINSSTGVITVAERSLLNYEAAPSHSVTVRVTDAGGLTRDQTFTITLANVNEDPATFTGGSISLQQKAIQTEDRRLQSEGLRPPNVETVESKNVAYPAYSQDEVVNRIPQYGIRSDVSKEPPSISPAQIVAVTRFLDEMASSEGPSPIHELLDRHFDEIKQLLQTAEDEAPSDPMFIRSQPDHLPTVLSAWLIANAVNLVPTRKPLVRARQSEGDKPTSLENEGRQSF